MSNELSGIMFRTLTPDEEKEFRQWATDNYDPDREVNAYWHPVIRDEWEMIVNKSPNKFLMPVLRGFADGQVCITTSNGWELKYESGMVTTWQHVPLGFELVMAIGSLCDGARVTGMLVRPLEGQPLIAFSELACGPDEVYDTVGGQVTLAANRVLANLLELYLG